MKVLRSKNSSIEQKCEVLHEFCNWFDLPQTIVELFLNFDNDQNGMPNLVRSIVSTVAKLSSKSDVMSVLPMVLPTATDKPDEIKDEETEKEIELQILAQNCLVIILRSIMNAAATAHVMQANNKSSSPSSAKPYSGWLDDSKPASPLPPTTPSVDAPPGELSRRSSVRLRHDFRASNDALLEEALSLIEKKESVRKGLVLLIEKGYIRLSTREISNFLKMNQSRIDEKVLGDFLGEDGIGAFGEKFMNDLRDEFIGGACFSGLTFEYCLRYVLTKAGFRLPVHIFLYI
jgi:Sec7-like guanine-nucleotide exchange factor